MAGLVDEEGAAFDEADEQSAPDLYPIYQRMDGMLQWLRENHPEVFDDQKHLDEGSAERAYWHYGYAVALRDAFAKLRDGHEMDDHQNAVRVAKQATGEE